jgi:hypothetical protein
LKSLNLLISMAILVLAATACSTAVSTATSTVSAGAPAQPSASMGAPGGGAAAYCGQMTSDKRIQDLPQALRSAMVDGEKSQVADAVAALRQYAAKGLGQPALDVASYLEQVATRPTSDAAVKGFASAAQRLDATVKAKCHTQ